MEIDFLRHYGFSPELLATLRASYGDILLPLQERVIHEGHLFDHESLLLCAPTSSGKTFLAEILFLHHARQGRNVILLAPTKALANQRYHQWKERYEKHGFDVVLSTRDHPFHDRRILEGRFHAAIIIYEKMRMLLSQSDAFLASLGACVVDEIHYLFHTDRGPDLELLLTRLRQEKNLQIVGLSAVVADAPTANWLNARLIVEKERPVELRQGVLCQGQFTYREFNSGNEGHEQFFRSESRDEGQAMLEAGCHFAQKGETTLLFWPQRDQCYTAARKFAQIFTPESPLEIPELKNYESTTLRDFLAQLLPGRIAVHTSDLSPPERDLVERLAREGAIRLICATSTLAEGINFPVVNVLTTRRMYTSRPDDVASGRPPAALPIPADRLWNMIGRAGRLGLSPYGRGIVITPSPGDVEGLMALYMRSDPPALSPTLHQIPLNQTILKGMGYWGSLTSDACTVRLTETLSGQTGGFPKSMPEDVHRQCAVLRDQGYVTEEMGTLYPTPLGELVMRNGLSDESARRLDHAIRSQTSHTPHAFDLIFLLCTLPELEDLYIAVSRQDIRAHAWSRAAAEHADQLGLPENASLRAALREPARIRPTQHSAFKKTLLLWEWIAGASMPTLETRYGAYCGMIQRLGEEAAWVCGCLADTAAAHAFELSWIQPITTLRERLLFGLPEQCLGWAPFLSPRTLGREKVLELLKAGFESPAHIRQEDERLLRSILPDDLVETIFLHFMNVPIHAKTAEYEIFFDEHQPNRFQIDGAIIQITPIEFRLLRKLAQQTGVCVHYPDLMEAMWPNSDGDKKQISRQKNRLLHKMESALGKKCDGFIEAIPGIGLTLHAQVRKP